MTMDGWLGSRVVQDHTESFPTVKFWVYLASVIPIALVQNMPYNSMPISGFMYTCCYTQHGLWKNSVQFVFAALKCLMREAKHTLWRRLGRVLFPWAVLKSVRKHNTASGWFLFTTLPFLGNPGNSCIVGKTHTCEPLWTRSTFQSGLQFCSWMRFRNNSLILFAVGRWLLGISLFRFFFPSPWFGPMNGIEYKPLQHVLRNVQCFMLQFPNGMMRLH